MQMVLDFVIQNWYYIVSLLLLIVSTIVGICKKKASLNLSDTVKAAVSEFIPGLIQVAEMTGKSGDEKLQMVVDLGLNKVTNMFGVSLSVAQQEYWSTYIRKYVEDVLKTPQKKEVK